MRNVKTSDWHECNCNQTLMDVAICFFNYFSKRIFRLQSPLRSTSSPCRELSQSNGSRRPLQFECTAPTVIPSTRQENWRSIGQLKWRIYTAHSLDCFFFILKFTRIKCKSNTLSEGAHVIWGVQWNENKGETVRAVPFKICVQRA
jgi:hypothetical protein